MARGSGRVRTPDTQPQRLIWTPVMTLGAARTPCLLLAQLNLSKNTRKGPLPPTHQAPRKPTMEVTACPPDPSACSFPSFWQADCPGAPRAHGTGEGGSTCPHIGVSLGLGSRWESRWGSSGPGASRGLRQGRRSPGGGAERTGVHPVSSGSLVLAPPADPALTTEHGSLPPAPASLGIGGKTGR